jgi:hypothetical protein
LDYSYIHQPHSHHLLIITGRIAKEVVQNLGLGTGGERLQNMSPLMSINCMAILYSSYQAGGREVVQDPGLGTGGEVDEI